MFTFNQGFLDRIGDDLDVKAGVPYTPDAVGQKIEEMNKRKEGKKLLTCKAKRERIA